MILLTGASGTVGSALLARLLDHGRPVRCLVRDPRELGAERVRVQIALGDLGDPSSFRHALRGIDCVIHLAASARDSPRASIEELNSLATVRLLRAAEEARVERFLFLSALGASVHAAARFLRARALGEKAVAEARIDATILAPALVMAPGDRLLTVLDRMSWLPAVPVPGDGRARHQPIAAEDVAACALAALERPASGRFELAGPDVLTLDDLVRAVARARGRRRRHIYVPDALTHPLLGGLERAFPPAAFTTSDEVRLLASSMGTARGTADVELLGVRPRSLGQLLQGTDRPGR